MILFEEHGINYNPETDYNIEPCDLICIGNLDRSIMETKVLEDNDTSAIIKGEYSIYNKYAVMGGEIVLITSSSVNQDKNTVLNLDREKYGTTKRNWKGYMFRTVIIIDSTNEIDLIDWSFEDTTGSVGNNLFPVELGSGSINMKSDLSLWSYTSAYKKFRVRNRKTVAYIFKGLGNKRFLKFTTLVTKLGVNTRGKNDPNKVKFEIKTMLAKWYDKDLSVNKQLKSTTPKEFFKMLFNIEDEDVYYANGVDGNSFLKINNLHTKEYKKVSEILKAYCSNGVRFCFDRFERVKIFSDFKVNRIESQKTVYEDLTESTITEDEAMIYNTINTQSTQRQTMYNFEDLDSKYVTYLKVLRNAISSNEIILMQQNGDYEAKSITIINEELHKSSQIGDIVCFKRTIEPYSEYFAKILDKDVGNVVHIMAVRYDKDFLLFNRGKGREMYELLNVNVCPMDLHYVRQELPMIFKYAKNKGGETVDSFLELPILPKVNGETLYPLETNIEFGSASNLKVGNYTGIVEEVGKIYGTWDSRHLLYNREIDQFSNTIYPPIYALTNKVNERVLENGSQILNYTHFDNSNFLLEVKEPNDNKNDATLIMYNTSNVNKDIDLHIDTEISRKGNRILQVSDISAYKIGDVIIANRMDDLTPQEETEFDEKISTIRWTVIGKTSESKDGKSVHYIILNSDFAKRKSRDKKYSFTRFPNWSIVYLQELYFRGNPVIEFTQDVNGISKGTNYDGDRSVDIYGEKKYEFDSKQLDKEDMKMMMGYILDNFQAISNQTTKFNVPISTYNGIDIELLDVITVKDPVYTKIDESNKWIVVSVTNKSGTNIVQLKLLNLNNSDTKPFKIDVKDVLEYKPVEIPLYDHNGSEGTGGGENDGTGGDGEDNFLGLFNMSQVDPNKFRAKIDRFENDFIYFKDFAGEEWETYASKLFPESEFGISVNGETLLIQSDMRYRAFIKKRDIYNTGELALLLKEDDVTFLIMSSFTDIDGRFYSRRCMIGDGKTYFSFDPVRGAKFVGDFVIGDDNKNASNDLWVSLQNNRTFQQDEPPISTKEYALKKGDVWYDLNDMNHPYRYNGDAWRSCRDGSIISTKTSTFIQPDEPIATEGRPINDGSTWYDSGEGYKPYVRKDGVWVNVTDRTLEATIVEAKKEAQKALDKLTDIADDNKLTESEKQSTKKEWEIIEGEYPKIIEEASKLSVPYGEYSNYYLNLKGYLEPLLIDLNSVSDINGSVFRTRFKLYYDSRQTLLNKISSKIKELADNAQKDATTALGNSKIFMTPIAPTQGMKENDLWYNTSKGNEPYVYSETNGWVSARDKIFETAGGNKVYFQDTEPPKTGEGTKEGDMWFKTSANNMMYVLTKGKWILANDALDKINTGRIVLNGNTTVNGDFKVKGSSIELTGDTKITGELSVYGYERGVISYNGTDEASSNKRVMILGGEILFQEKVGG